MEVTVIIPTYNRPNDLRMCLESIKIQKVTPNEIIIVDNGNNHESLNISNDFKEGLFALDCVLLYIKNEINSLTVARNLGVSRARGEIVIFLDDDVVLDIDYIHELLNVYKLHPNALGVQGFIKNSEKRTIRDFVFRLFFWYHFEEKRCRVLPSISTTYPDKLEGISLCQWLSGANHSYRRKIFEEFKYDERLIKYSDGEDLDLSYRVYKKYPHTLYITPFAKVLHNTSMVGRAIGMELVFMQEVYGLYLFHKLFKQNYYNKTVYLWSRLGRLLITIYKTIIKRYPGSFAELRHLIQAYFYCFKHVKEIKQGNLSFFNETLKI